MHFGFIDVILRFDHSCPSSGWHQTYMIVAVEWFRHTINILYMYSWHFIYMYMVVTPYLLIYYPRFQLSAVYRGPKKMLKNKEINGS
jgi:uncharacterized membrane protein SpoIIM required for sporulation